jgi:gamma-glutamylcyclotransferase (GGCT)/AIG2-like uncharacterized protein YtfP
MIAESLKTKSIKIFVFGTLRQGGRLDYYMDGSDFMGKYYTEGQLMKSELGSAYIDFSLKNVATLGELHVINFPSLQRIDHLEGKSGEFPKGYDLDIIPVWELKESGNFSFDDATKSYAFFYKRRDMPIKITSGDWIEQPQPIEEIQNYLKKHNGNVTCDALIDYIRTYLGLK